MNKIYDPRKAPKCRHKDKCEISSFVPSPLVRLGENEYRFVTHWCRGCGCLRVTRNNLNSSARWVGHIMNDFLVTQ